ncbi:hypothetical protein [Streptomyces sp. G45]|uniref:hypothetical protein n=1 Tax=Streptomyces sp. G45 TaxID=3406627 RepID=UPI003C19B93F
MAARLGRDEKAAEDLLEGLVDAGLLTSTGPGCYQMHHLARLYAQSRTGSMGPAEPVERTDGGEPPTWGLA